MSICCSFTSSLSHSADQYVPAESCMNAASCGSRARLCRLPSPVRDNSDEPRFRDPLEVVLAAVVAGVLVSVPLKAVPVPVLGPEADCVIEPLRGVLVGKSL